MVSLIGPTKRYQAALIWALPTGDLVTLAADAKAPNINEVASKGILIKIVYKLIKIIKHKTLNSATTAIDSMLNNDLIRFASSTPTNTSRSSALHSRWNKKASKPGKRDLLTSDSVCQSTSSGVMKWPSILSNHF